MYQHFLVKLSQIMLDLQIYIRFGVFMMKYNTFSANKFSAFKPQTHFSNYTKDHNQFAILY